jgi:hypothetical protein
LREEDPAVSLQYYRHSAITTFYIHASVQFGKSMGLSPSDDACPAAVLVPVTPASESTDALEQTCSEQTTSQLSGVAGNTFLTTASSDAAPIANRGVATKPLTTDFSSGSFQGTATAAMMIAAGSLII